jgi:hypothetical protein
MIAYIIIIVVVAVLLVGVGSTMFLRPRACTEFGAAETASST